MKCSRVFSRFIATFIGFYVFREIIFQIFFSKILSLTFEIFSVIWAKQVWRVEEVFITIIFDIFHFCYHFTLFSHIIFCLLNMYCFHHLCFHRFEKCFYFSSYLFLTHHLTNFSLFHFRIFSQICLKNVFINQILNMFFVYLWIFIEKLYLF